MERRKSRQQSSKWGIRIHGAPWKPFKGKVLRDLISKSSTLIFTFLKTDLWLRSHTGAQLLRLPWPFLCLKENRLHFANPESYSGVVLWGGQTSCLPNKEIIQNTVVDIKQVRAPDEGPDNKSFTRQVVTNAFP